MLILIFLVVIIVSLTIAAIIAKNQVIKKPAKASNTSYTKTDYDSIDYKMLYLVKYKRLPHTYYIMTLIGVIAVGVLDVLIFSDLLSDAYEGLFSFLIGSEDYISGILALAIWVAIAFGAAHLVRYLSAIVLSQKIVVADTLLELKNCTHQMITKE